MKVIFQFAFMSPKLKSINLRTLHKCSDSVMQMGSVNGYLYKLAG